MAKRSLGRHWLVWPDDATEWMLTYSEELADRIRVAGGGCIEFREHKPKADKLPKAINRVEVSL